MTAPTDNGWMPIETAPKDGTLLLFAAEFDGPGDWRIKMGYWSDDWNDWSLWGASWKPTRWQPLPPAPGANMTTFEHEGVTFNFNGDLSGMVEVHFGAHPHNKMQFPGSSLRAFLVHWMRGEKMRLLEQATDDEILGIYEPPQELT